METDIRAVAPAAGRGTRLPREDIHRLRPGNARVENIAGRGEGRA